MENPGKVFGVVVLGIIKISYFAPSGLGKGLFVFTQGDALGWSIAPRWGWNEDVSGSWLSSGQC
ncbi:MAG: hypothetical protein JXD22_14880 [Sedimentisphaerales bacterium]|nr:hypothetical protein [Sedimentisphaerales bacterium]